MTILETLISTIGFSVAKGLLNVWLKDLPVNKAIAEDVLGLIKTRTSDLLTARKGERFFEEIGDKIALTLVPLFESYEVEPDKIGQRKVSVEAVAKEVSTAIDSSNISSKLLASLSYSPTELLKFINRSYSIKYKSFSQSEESLYERTLDLCAQHIIDIAPTLPDYTSSNFIEVLNRLDKSMEKVDEVLKTLSSINSASEKYKKQQDTDFERNYRANILRKLDKVNLFGVDVKRQTKRYKLSVAYVSLHLTSAIDNNYYLLGENVIEEDDENSRRLSVEVALASSTRTIIIGEAGSGKTTLLQWLAVTSASNQFDRRMVEWRDTVPFFIELRRFPDKLPNFDEFVEHISPELAAQTPKGWTYNLLKSGRAVLLIDGIDEVSKFRRERVFNWIEELIEQFPNTHFIVSSRPNAYQLAELSFLEFNEFSLASMDNDEVRLFVEYWHKAVLIDGGLETKEHTEVIVEKLMTEIKNNLPLSRLATNPLLCAMICALYYDRNMQLPSDRLALYEACCVMLIEQRDVEKEINLELQPKLTYKQKKVLLDDLAYWMMKNGYTSISIDQAHRRIESHLPNLKIVLEDEFKNADVLSLLIERTGMVRFLPPKHFDFVHRTFQEYMAACAAVAEGDWGLLIKNCNNDLWKETIVLAAGLANKSDANDLINSLLDISEKRKKRQSYIDLLAISCLETTTEVSLDIRKRVEERLHRIAPPKSQNQINSLISAGELAIPYLDFKPDFSEEEAAACVEVLGRIGTLPALRKLGQYTKDYRKKVTNAIEKNLSLIAPEIIHQSGLSSSLVNTLDKYVKDGCIQISRSLILSLSLEPNTIWQEHVEEKIDHLKIVDFDESCSSVFASFPQISNLTVIGDALPNDLQTISALDNLKCLDIRNQAEVWPIFYLTPILHLQMLRLMCYSDDWPYFDNKDFPNLVELHIFSRDELNNLDKIRSFRKLKRLHLACPSAMPSLTPLKYLTHLEVLELSTSADYFPEVIIGLDDLSGLRKLIINLEVGKGSDLLLEDIEADVEMMKVGMEPCEVILRTDWSEKKW